MDPRLIVQSFFDTEHLGRLAAAHSDGYQNAEPFPHIVIDDFLPAELFEAVVAELPGPDEIAWDVYTDRGNTKKLATQNVALMGPVTRSLFAEFGLTPMIAFLESLTGIAGLVPDPHLVGGGLHVIETGGFLKVHADFNVHSHLQLDRRLNLLLYLNPDWDESWGGHLELWSRDMSACERRIAPIANRCVIFNTTDFSFHGHPEPLLSPPGVARRSLALYYYSNGRPDAERSAQHSTLYQAPGASPTGTDDTTPRRPSLVRRFVPPILVEAAHAAKVKLRSRDRRAGTPPEG